MGRMWCTSNDQNVNAKAGLSQHVLKTCPFPSKNQEQLVGIFIMCFSWLNGSFTFALWFFSWKHRVKFHQGTTQLPQSLSLWFSLCWKWTHDAVFRLSFPDLKVGIRCHLSLTLSGEERSQPSVHCLPGPAYVHSFLPFPSLPISWPLQPGPVLSFSYLLVECSWNQVTHNDIGMHTNNVIHHSIERLSFIINLLCIKIHTRIFPLKTAGLVFHFITPLPADVLFLHSQNSSKGIAWKQLLLTLHYAGVFCHGVSDHSTHWQAILKTSPPIFT